MSEKQNDVKGGAATAEGERPAKPQTAGEGQERKREDDSNVGSSAGEAAGGAS